MINLFTGYVLPFIVLALIIVYMLLRVGQGDGSVGLAIVFLLIALGPSFLYALIADDSSTTLFVVSVAVSLLVSGLMAIYLFDNKKKKENVVFIENAGGCICTKSVLGGKTPLKWCYRAKSVDSDDSGWRFIGRDDDEAYINIVANNAVVDFNTVANIEPAVLAIYNMPIDTDLYIEKGKDGKIRFFKTGTSEEMQIGY